MNASSDNPSIRNMFSEFYSQYGKNSTVDYSGNVMPRAKLSGDGNRVGGIHTMVKDIIQAKRLHGVYEELLASNSPHLNGINSFDDFVKKVESEGSIGGGANTGSGAETRASRLDHDFVKAVNSIYAKNVYGLSDDDLIRLYRTETNPQVSGDKNILGYTSMHPQMAANLNPMLRSWQNPFYTSDIKVSNLPQIIQTSGFSDEFAQFIPSALSKEMPIKPHGFNRNSGGRFFNPTNALYPNRITQEMLDAPLVKQKLIDFMRENNLSGMITRGDIFKRGQNSAGRTYSLNIDKLGGRATADEIKLIRFMQDELGIPLVSIKTGRGLDPFKLAMGGYINSGKIPHYRDGTPPSNPNFVYGMFSQGVKNLMGMQQIDARGNSDPISSWGAADVDHRVAAAAAAFSDDPNSQADAAFDAYFQAPYNPNALTMDYQGKTSKDYNREAVQQMAQGLVSLVSSQDTRAAAFTAMKENPGQTAMSFVPFLGSLTMPTDTPEEKAAADMAFLLDSVLVPLSVIPAVGTIGKVTQAAATAGKLGVGAGLKSTLTSAAKAAAITYLKEGQLPQMFKMPFQVGKGAVKGAVKGATSLGRAVGKRGSENKNKLLAGLLAASAPFLSGFSGDLGTLGLLGHQVPNVGIAGTAAALTALMLHNKTRRALKLISAYAVGTLPMLAPHAALLKFLSTLDPVSILGHDVSSLGLYGGLLGAGMLGAATIPNKTIRTLLRLGTGMQLPIAMNTFKTIKGLQHSSRSPFLGEKATEDFINMPGKYVKNWAKLSSYDRARYAKLLPQDDIPVEIGRSMGKGVYFSGPSQRYLSQPIFYGEDEKRFWYKASLTAKAWTKALLSPGFKKIWTDPYTTYKKNKDLGYIGMSYGHLLGAENSSKVSYLMGEPNSGWSMRPISGKDKTKFRGGKKNTVWTGELKTPQIEGYNYYPTPYGYGNKSYAMGGQINGMGTSMSDSIPAMLSNGEYVVRASSVDKYGTGFMDKLNQGVLKMAGGGYVNASAQMPKYNIPSRQMSTPSSTSVYNGGTTLATVNVYDSGNAKATAYEVANILNNMASRTNHKAGVRV